MLTIKGQTTFAVMSDGTLYGWGYNGYNQLGDGGTFDERRPSITLNIPKVKEFVFNGHTGVALGVDGYVYTWGKNPYGEAGNGTTGRLRYATKLTALGGNIDKIFNGNNAMYAIDDNGIAYGWGANRKLQVSAESSLSICTPTAIADIGSVQTIEKVGDIVFASDSDDVIYAWGDNTYGQVGDNTTVNVGVPFVVTNNEMVTTEGTGNVNSTVPIVGSINALEISITHPVNIAYAIDPNNEDGFYCADIQIQNNSKVPVKVRIEAFEASSDGDIVFQDIMPDGVDWNALNKQETKSYIALGLQYVDESQWLSSVTEMAEPLYAVEIDDTYIGVLGKGSAATLRLSGYHGLAFDSSYSAKHELVFIVSLL